MSAQQTPEAYKIKKVVIDAGHGGRDPGAVGSFSHEKDIVLKMALKLGGYIKENFPELEVIYTRKTDKFVQLYKRAEIANSANADLFISLHINGVESPRAYGTETFAMGLDKSKANLAIAKKENSVILKEDNYKENYDFDPASPESHIMFSMFQNAYLDQSLKLASFVQDQFTNRVGRKNRGVKQAAFWVLYKTTMPSILIEAGFISNPEEEKFLNSENGITYLSSAVYRAFRDYKDYYESQNKIKPEENLKPQDDDDDKIAKNDTSNVPVFPKDNNQEHQPDYCYRVQIGTSSEPVDDLEKKYPGLNNLWQYKHNGLFKHTCGKSQDYEEIKKIFRELRKNYKGCFIVGFKKDERTPIDQVKKALK